MSLRRVEEVAREIAEHHEDVKTRAKELNLSIALACEIEQALTQDRTALIEEVIKRLPEGKNIAEEFFSGWNSYRIEAIKILEGMK